MAQPDDAWFRWMVESAVDFAIFALDTEGKITSWNAGAHRMFRHSAEEILGQTASVLFTPEDRVIGDVEREISIAAAEGRASDDRWHVRRDGTRFWASGLLMAMRDERGVVRGFVKVIQDRTAEKRTEESLRRSEEQFARVFLGNPAAIAVELRDSERFMLVNEEFLALTGYWRAEALGRTGADLGVWVDPGQREQLLTRAANEARPSSARVDIRSKAGEVRRCIAAARQAAIEGQECFVITLLDITDQEGH
jgi:PAS domain S-box-containing protein